MAVIPQLLLKVAGPKLLRDFRRRCQQPEQEQRALLERIIRANSATAYGTSYRFSELFSFEDYQEEVPIVDYEDLEPYIERAMRGEPAQLTAERPVLYGMTSGTTGNPKYIPVTPEGRKTKAQLMRVWLAALHRDHPKAFARRILPIVSPEEESTAPDGTPCGAESGHGYKNIPALIRRSYACPYEVFEIEDYQSKYYTLLRLTAEQSLSLIYVCNPSTLILLGELLEEHTESIIREVRDGTLRDDLRMPAATFTMLRKRLRPNKRRAKELEAIAAAHDGVLRPGEIWPELAAIACWKGGTVKMYLDRLHQFYRPDTPVRDLGYFATELRGSVPLSDEGDSGVLSIQTNVYEFWPAEWGEQFDERRPLTVAQVEEGKRYLPIITTASGLYRYNMHDIIEVTGFFERTPMIRFVQKGKGFVSFTGEKLSETQVLHAAERALRSAPPGADFITAIGAMESEAVPRYHFLVEFRATPHPEEARETLSKLEQALSEENVEYAAKRRSLRLGAPVLRVLPRGEYNRFRERHVSSGHADAQFKLLRLSDDKDLLKQFRPTLEVSLDEDPRRAQAYGSELHRR